MKMCEQILKKRQRPNAIQILWIVTNSLNCKKESAKIIAAESLMAAFNK